MAKRGKKDSMKVPAEGQRWDCPRCGQPMQRWKHATGWKPEPGRSWFLYWFECLNRACRTTLVMPKGACVKPGEEPPPSTSGPDPLEELLDAEYGRLAHFKTL